MPISNYGGGPISVLQYLKNCSSDFRHVLIVGQGNKQLFNELAEASDKIHDLKIIRISLKNIRTFLKIFFKENSQIVSINGKGSALYTFLACLLLGKKDKKILYIFRGFHNRFKGYKRKLYILFEKWFNLFVDVYVAVSESEYKKALKSNLFLKDKIEIISDGRKFMPIVLPSYIMKRVKNADMNIITISRISPQKDLVTMLESFELLERYFSEKNKKVFLHIFGGVIESDLKYQKEVIIKAKEKANRTIFFYGEVPKAGSYIYHFDAYWTTSIWEGLPGSVIEAMMQKVLVIATDIVGNKDLIEDLITGYLTKPKDPTSIAQVFSQALEQNNKEIIECAYRKAMENFSIQKHVKNMEQLYTNLLA